MNEEILKKVHEAKKNLIIEGYISTGKTKNIGFPLVEKMIESKESLFILDSKTEYINQYYDLLKEKDYNIIIINHRNLNSSEGWNILEYPYNLYKAGQTDKSLNYLEQIGKELFYEGKSVDPFWSQSASDLFTGVTLGLFEDGKEEEINLSSINNMINLVTEKFGVGTYLTEYFKTKDTTDIAYICASGTVFAPTETRESIATVAKQKLRLLVSRELLSKQLNKTTFSFDDIVNKPTAVFFISKDESTYLNLLAAIFVSQLYSILVDKGNKNNFNFILDNFDSINNINDLVSMMSSGVSRNIKFTILTRSKSNLEEQYGSYINNLSNEITVTEKNIKLKISGEKTEIENKNEEIKLKEPEIDYPKLMDSHIQIFDLKKYVIEKKGSSLEKELAANPYNPNKYNVNDLIKEIDAKIEELDKEEKSTIETTVKADNNVESDLEQFKVEE